MLHFRSSLQGNICDFLPGLQAIQNPGDLALQEKAWNAVCPLVAKLKRFYEFSLRLGERVSHTWSAISGDARGAAEVKVTEGQGSGGKTSISDKPAARC